MCVCVDGLVPPIYIIPSVLSPTLQSDSGPLPDDFFDLLSRVQGERMEDQRSSFPHGGAGGGEGEDDEEETFLDAVWRVQGSRLEEQRSPMGAGVSTPPHVMVKGEDGEEEEEQGVSDDDLIELIQKSQVNIGHCLGMGVGEVVIARVPPVMGCLYHLR